MSPYLTGILTAVAALLLWGFGDFFIQRATRRIGIWETLFWNELAAVVFLLPFVLDDLRALEVGGASFFLLVVLSLIVLFAALFDFTALKQGKIAIVEPIQGLELPITIGLAIGVAGETIPPLQLLLMGAVFTGIVLAVTVSPRHLHYHRRIFERGVLFAGLGAVAMGLMNFLVGLSSRDTSPLLTLWFFSTFLLAVSCAYLLATTGKRAVIRNLRDHFGVISSQAIVDNLAWVAYAVSTTLIPISLATTVSESYIALAAFLGLAVNHERLRPHQLVGVALAIVGVTILAATSGR